jgi:mono/diheme cytochrome c family protein
MPPEYRRAVAPSQRDATMTERSQAPVAAPAPSAPEVAPQQALVARYCVSCHNSRTSAGGLALDQMDYSRVAADAVVWEKVVKKLRGNLMPPPRMPRPDPATYDGFAQWLEDELDRAATAHPKPGRTETFHRLNRAEYQNAVRDLLALDVDVVSLLPADDASFGFDNMAGSLKLDQSRLERYLTAATRISRSAVGWPLSDPTSHEFRASSEARQYEHIEGLPFGTRGGMLVQHTFPQDAEYEIRVELLCRLQGGDCDGAAGFADEHELDILVDGERAGLPGARAREGRATCHRRHVHGAAND